MKKPFVSLILCLPFGLLATENIENIYTNCGLNNQSIKLAKIIINYEGQNRIQLYCNKALAKAANIKAKQLATVDRIRHNIYNTSPNQFLRAQGFQLPILYEVIGNQVEAVSGGKTTPQETFDYFMTSSEHKKHLLGENDFYRSQNQIAVGFYEDKSKKYEQYWVVYITKKKSKADKPLFNVKHKIIFSHNIKKKSERKRYNPKDIDTSKYHK